MYDRYTKSRKLPFLTHIDGVRANLFSTNPRQKNENHYGKLTIVFFFFFFFFFFFLLLLLLFFVVVVVVVFHR